MKLFTLFAPVATAAVAVASSDTTTTTSPVAILDATTTTTAAGPPPPPSPAPQLYHLTESGSNTCFETGYTDANYASKGFVAGACPFQFNVFLSRDTEKVCNGHSEVNLKNCKTGVVTINIDKIGIGPPSTTFYHLLTHPTDRICYQSTYSDEDFVDQGWVSGKCPSQFNHVVDHDISTICAGHSGTNVKNCPTQLIQVDTEKIGISTDDGTDDDDDDDDDGCPLFHLTSEHSSICYETSYTDANYEADGWQPGACPSNFNTVLATSKTTVCNHHSDQNLQHCPTCAVTIDVVKKGIDC